MKLITVLCSIVLATLLPCFAFADTNTITIPDTNYHQTQTTTQIEIDSLQQSLATTTTDTTSMYPMSPERKAKLISYSRFNNIWRFVNFFVTIGVLCVILFTGFSARLRNLAQVAKKRFFIIWLFLILFLITDYILNFPFNVYRNFIVESDYGFMAQTFWQWWGEDLLGFAIGCVTTIIPVWFFYWLVGKFRRWWLLFSLGAIPFAVFFIIIAPVVISPLFNDFQPVSDKTLETKLLNLASKVGIEGADVFEVNASKQSTKVNAYVTGLFGTKRIVLFDNLIKNFSPDEIMFVMGHEMGHYVMHHVWWGLLVAIMFIMFSLWLTDKTIHPIIHKFRKRFGFDKLNDIASLPLVMLFLTVIMFFFQPITNGASRIMEHQADIFGMEVTGVSGETAAKAFDKLSVFNLSDPDPPAIIEFWFYSHPSLKKRMEFVRNYKKATK